MIKWISVLEELPRMYQVVLLLCVAHKPKYRDGSKVVFTGQVDCDAEGARFFMVPMAGDKEGCWHDDLMWEPTHWAPFTEIGELPQ